MNCSLKQELYFIIFCVGISKSNNDTETIYSVIFDNEFPSGLSFGGNTNSGYKMCKMSFINLTHAIRRGLYKPLDVQRIANQSSYSEKQVNNSIIYLQ